MVLDGILLMLMMMINEVESDIPFDHSRNGIKKLVDKSRRIGIEHACSRSTTKVDTN